MTEDEIAGWHHRLDGPESEWTPGVGDGQGGLACCDSWGRKESATTEWLNWTELNIKSWWNKNKLWEWCSAMEFRSVWFTPLTRILPKEETGPKWGNLNIFYLETWHWSAQSRTLLSQAAPYKKLAFFAHLNPKQMSGLSANLLANLYPPSLWYQCMNLCLNSKKARSKQTSQHQKKKKQENQQLFLSMP